MSALYPPDPPSERAPDLLELEAIGRWLDRLEEKDKHVSSSGLAEDMEQAELEEMLELLEREAAKRPAEAGVTEPALEDEEPEPIGPPTPVEQAVIGALAHVSEAYVELAEHHDQERSWPLDEDRVLALAESLSEATARAAGSSEMLTPAVCVGLLRPLYDYVRRSGSQEAAELLEMLTAQLTESADALPEGAGGENPHMLTVLDRHGKLVGVVGPFLSQQKAESFFRCSLPRIPGMRGESSPLLRSSASHMAQRMRSWEPEAEEEKELSEDIFSSGPGLSEDEYEYYDPYS